MNRDQFLKKLSAYKPTEETRQLLEKSRAHLFPQEMTAGEDEISCANGDEKQE